MIIDSIAALICDLKQHLNLIQLETGNISEQAEIAINIASTALQKLKDLILKHKNKNDGQEIYIFKCAMPQILSEIIYYSSIKSIHLYLPMGSATERKIYINSKLDKINTFFNNNRELIAYYRSGNKTLDDLYFTRKRFDKKLCCDPLYYQLDERFLTLHGHTIAKLIAFEKLQDYLNKLIFCLDNPMPEIQKSEVNFTSDFYWTGPPIWAVEILFALHAMKCINNGNAKLNAFADFLQKMFNIDLGQYHRKLSEIRDRKKDKTSFLTKLSQALLSKINDFEYEPEIN